MAVKKKILSHILLRVFSFISPYCFLLYIIWLIKSIADDQRFFLEHMYTFINRLNHESVVFQNSNNFNNGKLSTNCHHYMLVQSDVDKNTIFLGSFLSHIYNESVTPVESIRQHPWTVGCSELIQVIWFWCRIMGWLFPLTMHYHEFPYINVNCPVSLMDGFCPWPISPSPKLTPCEAECSLLRKTWWCFHYVV